MDEALVHRIKMVMLIDVEEQASRESGPDGDPDVCDEGWAILDAANYYGEGRSLAPPTDEEIIRRCLNFIARFKEI